MSIKDVPKGHRKTLTGGPESHSHYQSLAVDTLTLERFGDGPSLDVLPSGHPQLKR